MRLRKVKNAPEIIANHPDIVISDPSQYAGQWNNLFGNDNPIYLEVGAGKGKFITELAITNPDINYIGIEKFDSVIIRAVEKVDELQLKNVLLINDDAIKINDFFRKNEISHLYLNFSDPWPKSRHSKRRLTHPSFLKAYKKILQKGSILELKTDNEGLFEYSLIQFNNFGLKFKDINLDLHKEYNKDIITTEYEEKHKSLNQAILYAVVEF